MKRILVTILTAVYLLSNIGSTTASAAVIPLLNTNTSSAVTSNSSLTDTNTNDSSSQTKETKKKSTYKWPKGPSNLTSDAAILMDASSGFVLYEKNANKENYPASITKIMTTLLALENCSLNEIVTFSHNAVFSIESGSTHIARKEGEQLTMEQCLYAVMLASANEVSNAVAEHVAGSIDAFADMMNAKAKELGCKNTHFVNANGLHNDNHYTSPYDMALISQAALKNDTFRKITATKSYVIPKTNKSDQEFPMANHQQLLLGYKLTKKYDACIGGKTGYTNAARNTLVSFAEKDGITLICVVMKSTPTDQYKDTIRLFDFGFDNYQAYSVEDEDGLSATDNSMLFTRFNSILDSNSPLLYTDATSSYILPVGADAKDVTQKINLYDQPTVQNGKKVIGDITYTFEYKNVGKLDIYYTASDKPLLETVSLANDSNEQDSKSTLSSAVSSKSHQDIKPFIIIGILVACGILYFIYYIVVERPRKKRRNAYFQKRNSRRYDDFHL
ncbi:D-alanyl-D-alanine carboxypeptidase family protein [Anaerosporobacter faecicola]|uniref:D-alanyl-D-alanine carboxypeptidase family protein n=1 Tax=Anaerosporobacter faecicola TaxID=2718714 RepID=UPI00143B8A3E|nr:D-alanyl-D-alanine carboxypeptidase family protein [Anaerosporobacter faecicola]